jgi:hypothetical protein
MVRARDYAWIRNVREGTWDAFVLTLVETDASPEDVCAAAGLPARAVGPEVSEDVGLEDDTVEFAYTARLGPWLAFQGLNGYQMSLREHVEPMSRLGRVVGYFVNVNEMMSFYLADKGQLVREFDPLLEEPDEGEGDPLPEEEGLPFGHEQARPVAASLALIERVTGQRISKEWFLDETRQRLLISIVD